ncbi:MAG: hypothetical protein HYX48_03475 [Chlamydiales bacterium]|nr:hypothetical protein [Chlamydiales bacterium]
MDESKMTDLLKGLKTSPEAVEKLQGILRSSAESLKLLKEIQTASPADRELARQAFTKKQQEITQDYDRLLADMGLTKEMLEQYAADPKNFSPESWQYLEAFKSEMARESDAAHAELRGGGKKDKKAKLANKSQWMSA